MPDLQLTSAAVTARPTRVPAADGYLLGATLYPAERPWARLLINSGTAIPQRYYRRFAEWMAARGVSVLTYDYRGIGESRSGQRGDHRMSDWIGRDFPGALHALETAVPGSLPTFGLGHSFGGQLFGLTPATQRLDGLVFVAAQSGWVGHWDGPARWRMSLLMYGLLPAAGSVLGYVPGKLGLGEDLPGGVALEWARWCRSPGYCTDHAERGTAGYRDLTMPRLVVSFADDDYAPRPAVEALCGWLAPGYERVEFAPQDLAVDRLGHFGAFRPGFEETLWSPLERWLRMQADGSGVQP